MDNVQRRSRIHQRDTLRLAPGDLQKCIAHAREKDVALFLKAILIGLHTILRRIRPK